MNKACHGRQSMPTSYGCKLGQNESFISDDVYDNANAFLSFTMGQTKTNMSERII